MLLGRLISVPLGRSRLGTWWRWLRRWGAVLALAVIASVSGRATAGADSEGQLQVAGAGRTIIEGGTGGSAPVPVMTVLAFHATAHSGAFECLALAPAAGTGDGSGRFEVNAMYVTGTVSSMTVSGHTAVLHGIAKVTGIGAGQRKRPGQAGGVAETWTAPAHKGAGYSTPGPPMVARALAVVHTCVYDAWAAYDRRAIGTRLGAALRRPHREHTRVNKEIAISFAAYRAAVDLFPGDRLTVFDPLMRSLGHDPNNTSTDATTPVGVGNLAARAVLEFRHRDGANQLGDEAGGIAGVPYSDYSGYKSPNGPMDLRLAFDAAVGPDSSKRAAPRVPDATGAPLNHLLVWDPFARTSHIPPFSSPPLATF